MGSKEFEISAALKVCKVAWWQWREASEPSSKNHPLVIRMKQSKRLLRKNPRDKQKLKGLVTK